MTAQNLKKLTNTGVTLVAATTIVLSPYFKKNEIPYTEADKTNIPIYLEELRKIEENYDIKFQNAELHKIVAEQLGENFTVGDLRKIKTLTIDGISNHDLSDLKYLTNLYDLTIKNITVDLSDLKYNQKLERLNVHYSSIINSKDLPNSVQYIELVAVDVKDKHLCMPYNTVALRMYSTLFSSFTLKNPNSLIQFEYDSYGILDLSSLKDCINLKYIEITKSPNIKNSDVLAKLPSLKYLYLDNFAPIWLDMDTSKKLNYHDENQKEEIEFLINILDELTKKIIPTEMSDEEKIKNISLTVADLIEYDLRVEGKDDELATLYNNDPITYALRDGKGVCMGYGCLFSALANRTGIENYQNFSDNHTWNIVQTNEESLCYDITNLDKEYAIIRGEDNQPYANIKESYMSYFYYNDQDSLYYYGFTPEEMKADSYQGLIDELSHSESYDIGYISFAHERTPMENLKIRREMAKKLLPLVPIQLVNNIILTILEKKQQKRKVKKR